MTLTHQSAIDLMARFKTAAVAAGATGREPVFMQPAGSALIGEVIALSVRYGLAAGLLFSTAARASSNTVAASSPSAFAIPKN